MGEAKARGSYEERRDQRLNEMVESAEVLIALRVDEAGKLVLSSLARDNPVDESSPAIGFAEFLLANWPELAGQAMALKTTALAGGDREDIRAGVIELPNGLPAGEECDPVILGANGRVISSENGGPRVELPASVAANEP
jgi:hypothetical protein